MDNIFMTKAETIPKEKNSKASQDSHPQNEVSYLQEPGWSPQVMIVITSLEFLTQPELR
jgi:hypothetical protein